MICHGATFVDTIRSDPLISLGNMPKTHGHKKQRPMHLKLVLQRGAVYVYIHRTENSLLLSHLWGVAPSTFQVVYIFVIIFTEYLPHFRRG